MQSSWLKLGKKHRLYQLLVGLLPLIRIRSNWLALTVLIRILTMILRINTRHQNGSIITCCSSCRLGRYGSGDAVWLPTLPSAFMSIKTPRLKSASGLMLFTITASLPSVSLFFQKQPFIDDVGPRSVDYLGLVPPVNLVQE